MAPLHKMVMQPLVWDYEQVTSSKAYISKVIPAKGDPQVRCMCVDEKSDIRGCAVSTTEEILNPLLLILQPECHTLSQFL
jgi:hypothetical protein